MSTTRVGPAIDWTQAGSDVWNLMLDTARNKLIDVEQAGDERNVPDYTDLRNGMYPNQTASGTAAPQAMSGIPGMPMPHWALWAVVAVAGAFVVYKIAD